MGTDIPIITDLSPEQLLTLRATIDERLDAIRTAHIQQAEALGLTLVNGEGKKQRKRRTTHKEQD